MANYSYASYTGTGSQTDYAISFPYIDKSNVVVTVGGVSVPFTFLNASAVRCTTAPALNTAVQVRRRSNKGAVPVDFSDGSVLLEKDLDTLAQYTLYVAQELDDSTQDALVVIGQPNFQAIADDITAKSTTASTGATTATAQAVIATSQAGIAATQAGNAAASATSASTQAGNAAASATSASTQAGNAAAQVVLATTQAGNASTSATTAATQAGTATTQAAIATAQAAAAAASAASLAAPVGTPANLIINGNFNINQRAYVSGTATGVANQYTLDRWRVVVLGQNAAFAASGNGNIVTAPAGGVEQPIEGAMINSTTCAINWVGTASCLVDGIARAKGASFPTTIGTNCLVRFSNGTVSQVQVNTGALVASFDFRPRSIEAGLCKRYYRFQNWRWQGSAAGLGGPGMGWTWVYEPNMRVVPTITSTTSVGGGVALNGPNDVDGTGMYSTGDGNGTVICITYATAEI